MFNKTLENWKVYLIFWKFDKYISYFSKKKMEQYVLLKVGGDMAPEGVYYLVSYQPCFPKIADLVSIN